MGIWRRDYVTPIPLLSELTVKIIVYNILHSFPYSSAYLFSGSRWGCFDMTTTKLFTSLSASLYAEWHNNLQKCNIFIFNLVSDETPFDQFCSNAKRQPNAIIGTCCSMQVAFTIGKNIIFHLFKNPSRRKDKK